ncbi:MAG: hypothetical protein ACLSHC_06415 [Bilophila wadsworthia]
MGQVAGEEFADRGLVGFFGAAQVEQLAAEIAGARAGAGGQQYVGRALLDDLACS